jgi:quinolinate synthase
MLYKLWKVYLKDQKIIFGPDKNLGAWVAKKTGRDLVLWNGACMVHEIFSQQRILKLKNRHPEAKFIAHPECEEAILKMADYIGSTTGLLKYTINNQAKEFIVATESGIIHQMEKANPDKIFIPAPPDNSCACNDCPHMKRNTLEKLIYVLKMICLRLLFRLILLKELNYQLNVCLKYLPN